MNAVVLIARHVDENGVGLVIEQSIDCRTIVITPEGDIVESIDYDGINYIPCGINDKILVHYQNNQGVRTFKVVAIERSGHFFECEIIYDEEELIEMELLSIAEKAIAGEITVNKAHLKADELIITLLRYKKLNVIADAYSKVPKFYD